jgi:hypothetical protein
LGTRWVRTFFAVVDAAKTEGDAALVLVDGRHLQACRMELGDIAGWGERHRAELLRLLGGTEMGDAQVPDASTLDVHRDETGVRNRPFTDVVRHFTEQAVED